MKARTILCITLLALCHPQLWPQAVTTQFPPAVDEGAGEQVAPSIPVAHVVAPPAEGVPVRIEADTQSYQKTKTAIL